MQFTKLFSSILDSTIWQESKETKLVWVTMLAMCDRSGEVHASIPGLAVRAGVSIAECEAALACLMSPDPYSRTKDHDGRRVKEIDQGWELLNHAKYRALMSTEDRREYLRKKQQEHRAKTSTRVNTVNKCQSVSMPSTHTEAEAEAEAEVGLRATHAANAAAEKPKRRQTQNAPPEILEEILEQFALCTGRYAEWTPKRKAQANARWRDLVWRERWREAMDRAGQSSFCNGGGPQAWVMDLEFFLRPDTVTKLLEGKYDDRECVQPQRLTANQQREANNASSFEIFRRAAAEQAAAAASITHSQRAIADSRTTVLSEKNGRTDSAPDGDLARQSFDFR